MAKARAHLGFALTDKMAQAFGERVVTATELEIECMGLRFIGYYKVHKTWRIRTMLGLLGQSLQANHPKGLVPERPTEERMLVTGTR